MPLQYIHVVYNIQWTFVAAFELSVAARGFKIKPYVAREVKNALNRVSM